MLRHDRAPAPVIGGGLEEPVWAGSVFFQGLEGRVLGISWVRRGLVGLGGFGLGRLGGAEDGIWVRGYAEGLLWDPVAALLDKAGVSQPGLDLFIDLLGFFLGFGYGFFLFLLGLGFG